MSDPRGGEGDGTRSLRPVRRRNLADDIADSIRSRIFDGTYRPGEKLPPERELARQLKVNRGSLREALKKLQHLGLIRIRQGDGTRVLDFFQTANVDLIKYLFQESKLDRGRLLADLMVVRTHTCELIVRLAAGRAGAADLEKLRDRVREMRGGPGDVDAQRAVMFDFEFWEHLAQLGDNIVLSLIFNTVKPPMRLLRPLFSRLVPEPAAMLDTHEAVLEALIAGRTEEAASLTRAYLEAGARLLLEHHGRLAVEGGPAIEPEE
jgi:GntR family transcriptional repressor for pyruvate dehydrogenase complex